MRRLAVLVPLLVLVLCGCTGGRSAAGSSFEPATPGVLTVATAFLPAPGFWTGRPPTQGFEAQLVSALAQHLGLDRVHVVQVPFSRIVRGELGGADIVDGGGGEIAADVAQRLGRSRPTPALR